MSACGTLSKRLYFFIRLECFVRFYRSMKLRRQMSIKYALATMIDPIEQSHGV
jgi:hypothetical protein